MKIYAHRGASKYAPENTMPAFELAQKLGADGIELDLQLTKDQVPVIFHDENVRRTTNGTGFIKDYTLKELKTLDAGYRFSKHYQNTRILSFEEFLDWFADTNLLLNAELKTNVFDYPNIEERVLFLIEKYNVKKRTTISSFNHNTIKRVRDLDSNINLGWLTKRAIANIDQFLKQIGANQIHINKRLLFSKMIRTIINNQIPFRVYTVNQISFLKRSMQLNAEGIFTDIPDKMKKYIR